MLTFQISDPVRDSSLSAFLDFAVVRTALSCRQGFHRCFLLTGPHTFAAISARLLFPTPFAILLRVQAVPDAAKASVPKLLWLSRCCLLSPLREPRLAASRRPLEPTTSAALAPPSWFALLLRLAPLLQDLVNLAAHPSPPAPGLSFATASAALTSTTRSGRCTVPRAVQNPIT